MLARSVHGAILHSKMTPLCLNESLISVLGAIMQPTKQQVRAAVQVAAVVMPEVDNSSMCARFGASRAPCSGSSLTLLQQQRVLPQPQHTRAFSAAAAAAAGYQTASSNAGTSKQVQPDISFFGSHGLKMHALTAWATATAAGTALIMVGRMAEQEKTDAAGQKGAESASADAAPDKTGPPPAGMLPVRVAVPMGNTFGKHSPFPAQPAQSFQPAAKTIKKSKVSPPSSAKQQTLWKPSQRLASAQPHAAAAGDKQARLMAINSIADSIHRPLTAPSSSNQLQLQPKLSGSSAPQTTVAPAASLQQAAQISSSSGGFSLPSPPASLPRIHPMLAESADGLKGLSGLSSSSSSSSDMADDFIWAAVSSQDIAAVDIATDVSSTSSSKAGQRLSDDNVAVADQRNSNDRVTTDGRRFGARSAGKAAKSPTAAVAVRAAHLDAKHERERQAATLQREQQQKYSSSAPSATDAHVSYSSFGPGAHFGACRPHEVVKACRITGNSQVGTA